MIGATLLFWGAAPTCSSGEPTGGFTEFRQGPGLVAIAASADAVVIAEIARVHDGAFVARIIKSLHGDAGSASETTVSFSRFGPTEPRWAPYATGQKLVLFLQQTPGASWRIAGMSGEGELPVDEGFLYLTGHFVEGLDLQRYQAMGSEIASQRIALADFEDAITGLFACFSFSDREPPQQLCDDTALSAYSARSPLHRYLAKGAT